MEIKLEFLLLVFAVTVVFSERLGYDYCKIRSCPTNSHVFCQYKTSEVSERCGVVERAYLTDDEKRMILSLHNDFRATVYSGRELREAFKRPQPAAAYVSYLDWNEELEEIAHRWAIQCLPGEAVCSDVDEFDVNQFVTQRRTRNTAIELRIDGILWDWYNEVANYNKRFVEKYRDQDAFIWGTIHYSQLVWENTTSIGCTALRHYSDGYKRLKLVCNYGPAGNQAGHAVYTIRNETERLLRDDVY